MPALVMILLAQASPLGPDVKPLPEQQLQGFAVGMRVTLKSRRPAALQPNESGHSARLAFGPGQTGTILAFLEHTPTVVGMKVRYQTALIRWDAQTWYEWDVPLNRMKQGRVYGSAALERLRLENGAPVKLPAFELPATLELLEPTKAEDQARVAAFALGGRDAQRATGAPTRARCEPPLQTVANSYVLFMKPGFDPEELAASLKADRRVTVRRTWADSLLVESASLAPFSADTRVARIVDNCR